MNQPRSVGMPLGPQTDAGWVYLFSVSGTGSLTSRVIITMPLKEPHALPTTSHRQIWGEALRPSKQKTLPVCLPRGLTQGGS